MDTKIALIIGATGATGSELVKQLLEDNHYSQVHIFVRCKPDLEHQKLHNLFCVRLHQSSKADYTPS